MVAAIFLKREIMKLMRSAIPIITIIFILTSCTGGGGSITRKKPVYPSKVDSQMEKAFGVAERYYSKHSYQAALDTYQKFIKAYPYNKLTDEAYYKVGKINFLNKKWDEAIDDLRFLMNKSPDPHYRSKGGLLAVHAAYRKGDNAKAKELMDRTEPQFLSSKLQLRFYSLYIFVGEKLGENQFNLDYAYLRLADIYHGSSDRDLSSIRAYELISERKAMRYLDTWVATPIAANSIPSWFKDYPRGFSKPYVEFKWGKIYADAGQKSKAQKQLSRYIQSYPKHRYVEKARRMLEALGGEVKSVASYNGSIKIGVILPLSGPRSSFGDSTLRGIKCAAGVIPACRHELLKNTGEGFATIELKIHDSLDNADQVLRVMDQLIHEGVSAIIGPMSASLAEIAAKRAQEARIPLFPLTQKSDIMQLGDFIFQMGFDNAQQVQALVSHARKSDIKSFGIFHPTSNYGREMASLFSAEVERQGGKIAAQVSYDTSKPDLGSQARQLKLGVQRFSYSGKASGFEALFIPDSYWMVIRLAPALQFVTIKGIPLIGTNAWHDEKLNAAVFKDFPESFFADLFYEGDSRPITRQFVTSYKAAYGGIPTSLSALGFDAVHIIRQAASRSGSQKPSQIKEELLSTGQLSGVTGIISFNRGRAPQVRPVFLSPSKDGIVLVD